MSREEAWPRPGDTDTIPRARTGDTDTFPRGQFDRKSQLRQSKKTRKKSSVTDSPVRRGGGSDCDVSQTHHSHETEAERVAESPVRARESVSSSPRTVEAIVKAEMRSDNFTHILLNTSRTEYNSNYGNLI